MENYRRYYNLESYLFDEVGPAFRDNGHLSAFDFFCIVVWKANRAKSRVRELLRKKWKTTDLDSPVQELVTELRDKQSSKEKFGYLMQEWGFRLPMASAILAVLYPEEFTVYDWRVSEIVKYSGLEQKMV